MITFSKSSRDYYGAVTNTVYISEMRELKQRAVSNLTSLFPNLSDVEPDLNPVLSVPHVSALTVTLSPTSPLKSLSKCWLSSLPPTGCSGAAYYLL